MHQGVDVSAEAGSEVCALAAGTVEAIYTADVLQGTQIVLNHGDGLTSEYHYVEPVDGLKVGDTVIAGQVIATVAEPTGAEYKDGAHLHLEVFESGKNVDPAKYLTLEEK